MESMLVVESSRAGLGLLNSFEMNSARSFDISNSALYIRCTCRLPRRMSKMTAIFGLRSAMYVKFCSGPTPK
jgi:hypothetical protein